MNTSSGFYPIRDISDSKEGLGMVNFIFEDIGLHNFTPKHLSPNQRHVLFCVTMATEKVSKFFHAHK